MEEFPTVAELRAANRFAPNPGRRLASAVPREHGAHATGRIGAATTTECAGDTSRNIDLGIGIAPIIVPLKELIQRVIAYLASVEIPSAPEVMEAYLQGQYSDSDYACLMRLNGANPEAFTPVLQARRDRLTPAEYIQLGRRRETDDAAIADGLRRLGWINAQERTDRVELFDELPTIADHLHWLQRNVFDDEYVQHFGLMEGFEDRFWAKFGHDLRARGMKKDYAALHYAAHWLNPAPEQLKRMVWRLNPDDPKVENPFTLADYERVLQEQDVASYFRKRFKEIAYEVPAISYIKEWYRQGLIDKAELALYHRQLGYKPKDAELFADIDDLQKRRMRAASAHGWTTAAASSAWAVGQMETTQHTQVYQSLGYTLEEAETARKRATADLNRSVFTRAKSRALTSIVTEVKSALKVGVITQDKAAQILHDAGWPQQYARGLAQSESVSAGISRTKEVVGAVRKAYLRGEIKEQQSRLLLRQAGIVDASIDAYITIWDLQQTPARKQKTIQNIAKYLAEGLIGTDEAISRWTNLGYSDGDIRLFLADAHNQLARLAARMQAVKGRQDRQAQAALAMAQRRAEQLAVRARKKLMQVAPVAKLQKWARLGIIGHDLFYSRMKLYGYPDGAIHDYWKEACDGKKAACVEVSPPGTPPIGGGDRLP